MYRSSFSLNSCTFIVCAHFFSTHFTNALNEKDYHLAIRDFRHFMLFLGLKYFHLLCTFIKCYIFMLELSVWCATFKYSKKQEKNPNNSDVDWYSFITPSVPHLISSNIPGFPLFKREDVK